MSHEKTLTGWITTVVETHIIKLVKPIIKVGEWNSFNNKHPTIGKNRLTCDRCGKLWEKMPNDEYVNICMMEKEKNRCICDNCLSELDPKLLFPNNLDDD